MNEKKWYAVYTKPRWEKKVADLLTRKQLVNYCPLNKVLKQWSDRRKMVHEPLFPGYVFVQLDPSELSKARATEGVLNFVYWVGRVAVIRDEEINSIRGFLSEHKQVKLEKVPLHVEDEVRIESGPLRMLEGTVQQVGPRMVKVHLPSLGYMMVAEFERTNVTVIQKTAFSRKNKAS